MSGDENDEDGGFSGFRLDQPLDVRSVLHGGSVDSFMTSQERDLEAEDSKGLLNPEAYYDAADLLKYVDLSVCDSGCDLSPFEKMKLDMTDITDGAGKVFKKIVKAGVGVVCPPDARVKFHYTAFSENDEVPFDVSKLRRKFPESKKLCSGDLIQGLELGISTMRLNEEAHFIIHYDYAYGVLGCPPRILPKSSLLLKVELLSIELIDLPEDLDIENPAEENYNFETLYKKAESHRAAGTRLKQTEKNNSRAIKEYRTAINILNKIPLNCDEEEEKKNILATKAYVNLLVCLNDENAYRKVCLVYRDALIDGGESAKRNSKLLYNFAKAQVGLSNFSQAIRLFKRVKEMDKSASSAVDSALRNLEEKRKKEEAEEKFCFGKMFP